MTFFFTFQKECYFNKSSFEREEFDSDYLRQNGPQKVFRHSREQEKDLCILVVMQLTITVNASLKISEWPQIEENVNLDGKKAT